MVARTRLIVTLYVQCISCCLFENRTKDVNGMHSSLILTLIWRYNEQDAFIGYGVVSVTLYIYIYFFFTTAQQPPVGQGLLIIEVSRSHSDTPQSVGLCGRVITPTHRPLSDNTQHSQETILLRTHNPMKRETTEPHLRPRVHRVRHTVHTYTNKIWTNHKNL